MCLLSDFCHLENHKLYNRLGFTAPGGFTPERFLTFKLECCPSAPAADQAAYDDTTTADSIVVELQGGPHRVISLRGLDYPFGYVLVEWGYAETILTGVSTDEELLDEVTWYFGLDEADSDSLPGRVVNAPAPRVRPAPGTSARKASEGRRCWAATYRAGESHRRCSRRRTES